MFETQKSDKKQDKSKLNDKESIKLFKYCEAHDAIFPPLTQKYYIDSLNLSLKGCQMLILLSFSGKRLT